MKLFDFGIQNRWHLLAFKSFTFAYCLSEIGEFEVEAEKSETRNLSQHFQQMIEITHIL